MYMYEQYDGGFVLSLCRFWIFSVGIVTLVIEMSQNYSFLSHLLHDKHDEEVPIRMQSQYRKG